MIKMKIVIIDNYDSFTYNLAHLVKELGADVTVYRNDQFQLRELDRFDKVILSPGPGIPSEAGLLMDVIKTYAGRKPMLGVCLGHQAIGEAFGAITIDENKQTDCLYILIDSPVLSAAKKVYRWNEEGLSYTSGGIEKGSWVVVHDGHVV